MTQFPVARDWHISLRLASFQLSREKERERKREREKKRVIVRKLKRGGLVYAEAIGRRDLQKG